MQSEWEKRIKEARTQIDTLNSSLDDRRTPNMKAWLRFAAHLLDDANAALGHAAKASPKDAAMWHGFADFSIQHSMQIWKTARESVDKYGGPANVQEIGG